MFLYQKKNYKKIVVEDLETLHYVNNIILENKPEFVVFDTETTGLNIITDKPFLFTLAFDNYCIGFKYSKRFIEEILKTSKRLQTNDNYIGLFAHNLKFDLHMNLNSGVELDDNLLVRDSISVARLTEYADSKTSLSLETLGIKYVDSSSKFASKVIKDLINIENRKRLTELKNKLKVTFPKNSINTMMNNYRKRVKYIDDNDEVNTFISYNYTEPNYYDIYLQDKELVMNYALDDVVILNEYLKKSIRTLRVTDRGFRTFDRESKLIRVSLDMERQGFKLDIDYLLKSREILLDYKNRLYEDLHQRTNMNFSVNQHKVIMNFIKTNYGIVLESCDEKHLSELKYHSELKDIIKIILELRTVEKWISTYIDNKLNASINGRIHTYMNNNGAVSGRISCDLQQQPKEALYDIYKLEELNNDIRKGIVEEYSEEYNKRLLECELFHPRKAFITDEDRTLVFIDESQMELRVQAFYTILKSERPDTNLCRAYMPYECYKFDDDFNKILFDYKDLDMIKTFEDYTWFKLEDNEKWHKTDLHSETTKHAFPNVPVDSKAFKKYRKLGKMCNFLKVYQGGVQALKDSLNVEDSIAIALDSAFYKAFPMIKSYQEWVNKQANIYGYVGNLYGRRYYMNNSKFFYKLCNYLIQGTCADLIKEVEIKIYNYLKENNLKTKMIIPIHDEIIFSVPKDEMYIIPTLKHLMEDIKEIPYIPMVAEVEVSNTNWRDKKEYE